MSTFLQEAAAKLYEEVDSKSFRNTLIFLPSRRSVHFFNRELERKSAGASWFPKVLSIEDFILELTGLIIPGNTELTLKLYHQYSQLVGPEDRETLDRFAQWSGTLLSDFSDLDAYAIETDQLFQNISDIRNIEKWNPEDGNIEATDLQEAYLRNGAFMGKLYKAFSESLLEKNEAYLGLAYRKATEGFQQLYNRSFKAYSNVWFIGFNALNACEIQLIKQLRQLVHLKLVWDVDSYYLENRHQEAGMFIRQYLNLWPENNIVIKSTGFESPKNIYAYATNGKDGIAQITGQVLENQPLEAVTKTAVVLSDEKLLTPVLHSIPEKIDAFNITAALSLEQSVYSDWLMQFVQMHIETVESKKEFYHRNVLSIVNHPAVGAFILDEKKLHQAVQKLVKENFIYTNSKTLIDLFETAIHAEVLTLLFAKKTSLEAIVQASVTFLKVIQNGKKDEGFSLFQREQALGLIHALESLNQLIIDYQVQLNGKSLRMLLQQVVSLESVNFIGEPLKGLQVMGVLESRTLDFNRVILTSVNEGVLPAGKKGRSFIPFDVKREFQLPTHHEKDAIYAYHFYRLLQRAKEVHLIYDVSNEGIGNTEPSRFLKQLEVEWSNESKDRNFIHREWTISSKHNHPNTLEIAKSDSILLALKSLFEYGISPTAMNTYINSPIDFYFKYLVGLREVDEVYESLESRHIGDVMHDILEQTLTPYLNQILFEQVYNDLNKNLGDEVRKRLSELLGVKYLRGKNYLTKEFIVAYLKRFIDFEINRFKKSEVHLIGVEVGKKEHGEPLQRIIEVDGVSICVKGIADRVERENGQLRIVDYKSGVVTPTDLKVSEVDELFTNRKNSKALQLMTYAWLYFSYSNTENLEACIVSFPRMSSGFIPLNISGKNILDAEIMEVFEAELKRFFREMLNSDNPFVTNPDEEYTLFELIQ